MTAFRTLQVRTSKCALSELAAVGANQVSPSFSPRESSYSPRSDVRDEAVRRTSQSDVGDADQPVSGTA